MTMNLFARSYKTFAAATVFGAILLSSAAAAQPIPTEQDLLQQTASFTSAIGSKMASDNAAEYDVSGLAHTELAAVSTVEAPVKIASNAVLTSDHSVKVLNTRRLMAFRIVPVRFTFGW